MAEFTHTERRLRAVLPATFTADGTAGGVVTIDDTCDFKVKQEVLISAPLSPTLTLEIKRIISRTQLTVGPKSSSMFKYADISAYTTGIGSYIEAKEQERPKVPEQEVERLTYEEEPTIARRVVAVDKYGRKWDESNPLPVAATINVSNVGTPILYNVLAAIKNTEYSQLLPDDTAQFILRARNNAKLQISYVSGQTGTSYLTVIPGNIYSVEGVKLVGKTVYFRSSKPDTTIEIIAWT